MNSILASQGHILVHCLLSRKLIIALAADLTHAGSLFPPNYTLEKKWRRSLGFFKVIPTLHAPWCQMGNGCSSRQTSVQPGLNWEKTLCAPSKQSCWRKGRCNATMTSHTHYYLQDILWRFGVRLEAWSEQRGLKSCFFFRPFFDTSSHKGIFRGEIMREVVKFAAAGQCHLSERIKWCPSAIPSLRSNLVQVNSEVQMSRAMTKSTMVALLFKRILKDWRCDDNVKGSFFNFRITKC